jgi:hypothetical protein
MSNTTSPTGSTGFKSTLVRSVVPATFAAAAISLGVMAVAAPVAGAETGGETKVTKSCSAAGGTYTTTTVNGHRNSSCDFKGADGKDHVVLYVDGKLVERPY